jgi:multiple sugar transport system substrate-binding protein
VFDEQGETMTVDTDEWEAIWTSVIDLAKDNVFPQQPAQDQSQKWTAVSGDHFLSGRVAMSIISNGQLTDYINTMKNADKIEDFTPFDWDVVTVPAHPEAPGVSGYTYLTSLIGISAKAQNQEEAWKYMEFINSVEYAKLKSRSSYNMPVRLSFIKPRDGMKYNVQAFTKLAPAIGTDLSPVYLKKPNIYQVQNMGYEYFRKAFLGEVSVRKALQQWQAAGDAELKRMSSAPDATPGEPTPQPLVEPNVEPAPREETIEAPQ